MCRTPAPAISAYWRSSPVNAATAPESRTIHAASAAAAVPAIGTDTAPASQIA
jgi:hypothetical protein